jgi:4-coumarate--CoA ligase
MLHQSPAAVSSSAPVTIDPREDVFFLPFSSGTTGLPKGVMLTHHNIVSNICQTAWAPGNFAFCPDASECEKQPVTLLVVPMFHAFGTTVVSGLTLYNGGKVVMMPKFEPETFLRAFEKYRVSTFSVLLKQKSEKIYFSPPSSVFHLRWCPSWQTVPR